MLRIVGLFLAALAALAVHAISSDAASLGASFHDATPGARTTPVAGGQRERSVIGDDERTPVSDTTAFPYSAVASVELYDDGYTLIGTCTGTLIGPDALLTAAHCLWRNGAWTSHIRVVPGKNGDAEPFGSVYGTDWWVPTTYIDTGEAADFDWGIVRLPPGSLSDARWMEVTVQTTELLSAPDFQPTIVGYPAEKDEPTMWQSTAPRFDTVGPHSLRYANDTSGGESGAAIWSGNPGRRDFGRVIGVHTRGMDDRGSNSGNRIDAAMLANLLSGCAEVHCTIDVAADAPPESGGAARPFHAVGIAVAQD